MIKTHVIDAGSRYGIHPSWESVKELIEFDLFEVDKTENDRLKKKYRNSPNVNCHNMALWSESGPLNFNITKHKGLITTLTPDKDYLQKTEYWQDEWQVEGVFQIQATTIDTLAQEKSIHFLKLDTEGSELQILKGGVNTIQNSVLGIRCEVFFTPCLENVPLFGEIDEFMRTQGFELLNLDYRGKGAAQSAFADPEAYGKLVSSDGVWIRPIREIFSGPTENVVENVLRLSLFLLLNSASDLAVNLLCNSTKKGITFANYEEDPLFLNIKRKIQLLFKKLSYLPSMSLIEIDKTNQQIFGEKFPTLNRFWESDEDLIPPHTEWTMQKG